MILNVKRTFSLPCRTVLFAVLLIAGGCGQRGPLTLPVPPDGATSATPNAVPPVPIPDLKK